MQQRTSARSSTDMARKYQRVELGAHVEPPSTAATQTHAKPVMQQPMQSMSELEALIDQFSIALDAAKKTVQDMEAKPKTGPDGDIDTAKASYSDMDPSKLCYEFVAIEQRSKEYDSDKIPRPLPEDTTLLTILEETNNKFVELYKHLRDNTHHVVQMFRVCVSNQDFIDKTDKNQRKRLQMFLGACLAEDMRKNVPKLAEELKKLVSGDS